MAGKHDAEANGRDPFPIEDAAVYTRHAAQDGEVGRLQGGAPILTEPLADDTED